MPWTETDGNFTPAQEVQMYDYIDGDFVYNTQDCDLTNLVEELINDGLFCDLLDWKTLDDAERTRLKKMIRRWIEVARKDDD